MGHLSLGRSPVGSSTVLADSWRGGSKAALCVWWLARGIAALCQCGAQLVDRGPHLLGFDTAVVSRGQPFAVIEAKPLDHLRQRPRLVGRELEDDLGHRSPTTRSTYVGSATSSALPLALRRSRNAGTPSHSVWSSCLGGARSPGSSSLSG